MEPGCQNSRASCLTGARNLGTLSTMKVKRRPCPDVFTRAMGLLATTETEWENTEKHQGLCAALDRSKDTHGEGVRVIHNLFWSPEHNAFWWGEITPQSYTARIIALQLASLLVAEDNTAIYSQ